MENDVIIVRDLTIHVGVNPRRATEARVSVVTRVAPYLDSLFFFTFLLLLLLLLCAVSFEFSSLMAVLYATISFPPVLGFHCTCSRSRFISIRNVLYCWNQKIRSKNNKQKCMPYPISWNHIPSSASYISFPDELYSSLSIRDLD